MLTFLAVVICSTFAGLVLGEEILARPVDWLGRRVPPSGAEFDAPSDRPLTRQLVRLVEQGRATVVDGVAYVVDGSPLGKPLVCPPCAAWWVAVAMTVAVAVLFTPLWIVACAPPASFILATMAGR